MNTQLARMSCYSLLVLIMAGIAGAQEPVAGNNRVQRYALLIGIDDYAEPLGKLEYCHNDMVALQAHLEAAGFAAEDITLMYDNAEQQRLRPTKANIESELRLRLKMANPDDIVVVAFSGHGLHLDGKSYLCPIDATIDSDSSLVAINDIYAQLEKCPASQKLLVVDACRNEPLVRGFKSGQSQDALTLQLQEPPKGVCVLSSCEAGQFSAEDAKLQHGVFMHFLMEGLKGAADLSDNEGNANGKISLDELYFFAHEKTKRYVYQSHRIVQRPVMKGEIVGRFDLAMVPDSANRAKLDQLPVTAAKPVSPGDSPSVRTSNVLLQADTYLSQADYENAIAAYTAIIDDTAHAVEIRREARKSRGAAYLARGAKSDVNKALIDQQAAGLPGAHLTIRAPSADLKVQDSINGRVRQNQSVLVTLVQGDWLWVAAVDGSDKLKGYIPMSAVLAQPAPQPVPRPQTQSYDEERYPESGSSSHPRPRQPRSQPPLRPIDTPEWEPLWKARQMQEEYDRYKRNR